MLDQTAAEGVVRIDHARAQPRPGEQLRLRGAIRAHRAVVVEMVARQIGEQRHREIDAVDAALIDAVRRDFHHDRIGARALVQREHLVQRRGVGRGIRRRPDRRTEQAVAERAQHRGAASGRMQSGGDPVRGRRLAVGAGDADHPQILRRMSVDEIGDHAKARLEMVQRQMRQVSRRDPRRIPAYPRKSRPRHERSRRECRRVRRAAFPGYAANTSPGTHIAAVGRDARHRMVEALEQRGDVGVGGERAAHWRPPSTAMLRRFPIVPAAASLTPQMCNVACRPPLALADALFGPRLRPARASVLGSAPRHSLGTFALALSCLFLDVGAVRRQDRRC